MTVIKYEQLRTLICGVTLEGHFDLKMLVINFCSLGRSFMNIAKYFRYKKWLSREEEKCNPPPLPLKIQKHCGMWVSGMCEQIAKIISAIYDESYWKCCILSTGCFKKKLLVKKIETYSKIDPYLCSFDISHYWN